MRTSQALNGTGDTLQDIVECYSSYLGQNHDLADYCSQFQKRKSRDLSAAQAEAVVSSWLRAAELDTRIFEDPGTGGPDFCVTHSDTDRFLVEATSLDSDKVAERSGLPAQIIESGGAAFGWITEKLKAKAQSKAKQLSGRGVATVLAITSNHAFASELMGELTAEYLMTSEPQFNVPVDGGREYMTTDLQNSVFLRPARPLDDSGAPNIEFALRSISAILLIAVCHCTSRIVGLLHPHGANPFNPHWLPMVPFVKFSGTVSHTNITTEWVQDEDRCEAATFLHRCVR